MLEGDTFKVAGFDVNYWNFFPFGRFAMWKFVWSIYLWHCRCVFVQIDSNAAARRLQSHAPLAIFQYTTVRVELCRLWYIALTATVSNSNLIMKICIAIDSLFFLFRFNLNSIFNSIINSENIHRVSVYVHLKQNRKQSRVLTMMLLATKQLTK